MGLSLSMGNQLIAPVVALLLFCISCISTSDDSGDILPNETDSKVLIKTTQTFTNYKFIYRYIRPAKKLYSIYPKIVKIRFFF
jgi:hypothetical protein